MTQIRRTHALLLLVACLLVAAWLRLPDLPTAPPGLHYDEAANVILTGDIAFRDYRPVFISSYTGKEVLFFYLAAGLMRLLDESMFALRLTAAFVGLLTIAATYWLGRELGLRREVALIAVALLAVSFWHLVFSRLGFRVISQPLLQALTLALLLRGLRLGQWRWLLPAGVALGLAGYTYLAVRVFPLLLLLAALPLLRSRRRWVQLVTVMAVAAIVLTPLLAYFWQHPDAFWVRIGQVAPGQAGLSLGESVWRALQMFFLVGDPYIRFNLPQRPLLGPFWGTLLLVGWLSLFWRWRAWQADWRRSALLLLLCNPFIMLLPTALATNEIVPSNLRALGLIPLLFYLPALGLHVLLRSIEGWLQSRMVTLTVVATVVTLLILGGMLTNRLYFLEWADDPRLFYENDGDLVAAARYLETQSLANTTLYVAALHYQPPTFAALSRHYGQAKWLVGSQAIAFPASGEALYIFPHNSPLPEWAAPLFADLDSDGLAQSPFLALRRSSPPTITPPYSANVNFGNTLTLIGYNARPAYTGETMPVTLYWRVQRPPAASFVPFVHLEDVWRYRWSQIEAFAYPSAQWAEGELIVQRVELPLPPGAPPGPYRLRIGLFHPQTGERLPQLDENGRFAGDSFLLEFVGLLAGPIPEALPQPTHVLRQTVLPGLQLLGYSRGGANLATGETLPLALWWKATEPLPPMTTRLELLRPDNTGRILLNTQPVHNTYPFHQWYTPQFLIDHVDPTIPADFPPGAYRLQLRLLDKRNKTLLTAALGEVTITATERLFAPPPMQTVTDNPFGHDLRLIGYDLEETAVRTYTLRLAWQAQAPPAEDYTVFVHVLTPDGVCCVWQQDVMPRQNQYPTSRWLAGEVVIDSYNITLPAETAGGVYPLEIGLYLVETGLRLPVSGIGAAGDALFLRPLLVP